MAQPATSSNVSSLDLREGDPIQLNHPLGWVTARVIWSAVDFAGIGLEDCDHCEIWNLDLANTDHLKLIAPPF